ncbi:hypothetical protein Psyaliredsea_01170 [Psychrobacter alimentarius]
MGEDIAKAMGTLGHLTTLRRTQVGKFTIDDAITLSALEAMTLANREERLMPVDACIDIDATLLLTSEQCTRIHMGQRLNVFEQLTDDLKGYISEKVNKQLLRDKDEARKEQQIEHEIPVDVRLINEEGVFLGLGAISLNGRLQPKKLIQR